MNVRRVESRADLRRFIAFPYRHYKDDPIWVPPLRSEQRAQFNPAKNPMLDHCTYDLFLLVDGGTVVGRVSAFVDEIAVEHWGEPIGFFGSYECIDDDGAARTLLDTARGWLEARDMKAMRGPWSFASQEWGLVLEGYEPRPVIMAPHNPPYYHRQLTDYGFSKVKDLLVYVADLSSGYQIPERYLRITDKVAERYKLTVRHIDMRRLREEIIEIIEVINTSLAGNWGFYPVTLAEAEAIARDLKPIILPESVLIAEDSDGRMIGFSIPLPDINTILATIKGGRLLPFGWLKLLWGIRRIREFRLWALGVLPEYHGKGVDALLYRQTWEVMGPRMARVEVNYVLEDNVAMNNALKKLGVEDLRKYRVYERPIGG